ncbi:MAG TPA: dihydrolipoamide acetyltransferase family protein [Acidimicrobiales bacterium]|nr:dihydrolipoamide acetyltransferase family protein [Acidimicrobiales bacterium]
MADITMPQLGETVTEGTITRWAKQVGDKVAEDEVLFEVSTDKVDSEVPSPTSGYLSEILVQEGETADVGARLAVISDGPPEGGSAPAPEAEAHEAAAAEEPEQQPADEPPGDPDLGGEGDAADSDAAEDEAAEGSAAGQQSLEVDESPAAPSGAGTRPADERPPARPGGGGGDGRVLSPVVRRLIAEHNLNPDEIEGTGAGGRITRTDVLALIDTRGGQAQPAPQEAPAGPVDTTPEPAPSPTPAPAPAAQAQPQQSQPQSQPQRAPEAPRPQPTAPPAPAPAPQPIAAVAAGERDEVIAFSNIRKRTAEHMVRSKATSAHTLVAIETDYNAVDKARSALKDSFKEEEGFSLTYLPFISRAVVDAIREFPKMNASVGTDELIVHRYVNLGIAVDLNFEGLLAPVVRDADGKRLRAIAREISDLANRARSKRLAADEISGGTFTLTNPGPFGTFITAPVINQPQIAILSTDGIKKKPVVVTASDGSDSIAIHPVGILALSFDHRAVDGAYASAFLAKVKEIIETRDWAQEL